MTLPSGAPFASRLLERTLAALCDGGLEEEALRLMCAPRQGCPVSLPCEADWLVACTEDGHGVSSKRLSAWPRLDAIADAKGACCVRDDTENPLCALHRFFDAESGECVLVGCQTHGGALRWVADSLLQGKGRVRPGGVVLRDAGALGSLQVVLTRTLPSGETVVALTGRVLHACGSGGEGCPPLPLADEPGAARLCGHPVGVHRCCYSGCEVLTSLDWPRAHLMRTLDARAHAVSGRLLSRGHMRLSQGVLTLFLWHVRCGAAHRAARAFLGEDPGTQTVHFSSRRDPQGQVSFVVERAAPAWDGITTFPLVAPGQGRKRARELHLAAGGCTSRGSARCAFFVLDLSVFWCQQGGAVHCCGAGSCTRAALTPDGRCPVSGALLRRVSEEGDGSGGRCTAVAGRRRAHVEKEEDGEDGEEDAPQGKRPKKCSVIHLGIRDRPTGQSASSTMQQVADVVDRLFDTAMRRRLQEEGDQVARTDAQGAVLRELQARVRMAQAGARHPQGPLTPWQVQERLMQARMAKLANTSGAVPYMGLFRWRERLVKRLLFSLQEVAFRWRLEDVRGIGLRSFCVHALHLMIAQGRAGSVLDAERMEVPPLFNMALPRRERISKVAGIPMFSFQVGEKVKGVVEALHRRCEEGGRPRDMLLRIMREVREEMREEVARAREPGVLLGPK